MSIWHFAHQLARSVLWYLECLVGLLVAGLFLAAFVIDWYFGGQDHDQP